MKLEDLVDQAKAFPPIRVAVVDAAQSVVIEALREAYASGIVEPRLIGDAGSIRVDRGRGHAAAEPGLGCAPQSEHACCPPSV